MSAASRSNAQSKQFFSDLDKISTEMLASLQKTVAEEEVAKALIIAEEKTVKDMLRTGGTLNTEHEERLEKEIFQGLRTEAMMLKFISESDLQLQKLNQAKEQLGRHKSQMLESLGTIKNIIGAVHESATEDNSDAIHESIKGIRTQFKKIKGELQGINYAITQILTAQDHNLEGMEKAELFVNTKQASVAQMNTLVRDSNNNLINKLMRKENKFEELLEDITERMVAANSRIQEMSRRTELIKNQLNIK